MVKPLGWLVLSFSMSAALAAQSDVSGKVIYGDDNRIDYYQEENASIREAADATAAIIKSTQILQPQNGKVKISAETFGSEFSLCKDEPFFDQPAAANCSAFLVGDDLVATAGHCIADYNCSDYSFVFSFRMYDAKSAPNELPESEVYKCQKIVARELTRQQDYALVKLDRPVRGHRILKLDARVPKVGENLIVVGHPSGLPTKIAGDANVRSHDNGFFVANLDTYGGNSGSAVFKADTLDVVGILVRGETDFVWDSNNNCRRSNVCTNDSCMGEHSTNISYIVNAMK